MQQLIAEIKDISEILNWKYFIFETEFPDASANPEEYDGKIYGICCTPNECETLFISFLSNRRMCSPVNLKFFADDTDPEHEGYLYMLHTKTQFAGWEVHKAIVHLLKYLNSKYLDEFKVIDEGNYWDTEDEQLLIKTFGHYNLLLDQFVDALKTMPSVPDETPGTLADRLIAHLKNKFPDK
ncbi:MAG TPA: hypothetical protein VK907_05480 [Phnomibacter sp.]|nr:hypothetical protein [Phnomibacter sp.]